ncbi:MAG: putative rane protein [Paenibacillus sp.]|nr:putative rane protein [Paenibacillus sp.]
MASWVRAMQIAFTYAGTIVGAGFATGQEILQFFTRYGAGATATILLAGLLFVWLGTRMMLLAGSLRAASYEDLNKHLFGPKVGEWFSLFTLVMLFGITTVMLAGGGSVFNEHFNLSYQTGLLITLVFAYLVIAKGLQAIVAVNSVVVPLMVLFCALMVISTIGTPGADNWLTMTSDASALNVWSAPFLYVSYNLVTAQAVLVPLGASIADRKTIVRGGVIGGTLVTAMLVAGHYALASQMPGIAQFEIPMSRLIARLGENVQLLFICVIFGEIFTTYIANVYGLTLQIRQRTGWPVKPVILAILIGTYLIGQIGFSTLLSTLYPLFGMLGLIWFVRIMMSRSRTAG